MRNTDLSAAYELAALIRDRVPGWDEWTPAGHVWVWDDPDDDTDRAVVVDGRQWELSDPNPPGLGVIPPPKSRRSGPTVVGHAKGLVVTLRLPQLVDRGDLHAAVEAMQTIGALPPAPVPPAAVPARDGQQTPTWDFLTEAIIEGANNNCPDCSLWTCPAHAARAVVEACRREDLFILEQPLADELVEQAKKDGYALAVQRLRDDTRYGRWWIAREYDPGERYWEAAPRGQLADYLETVERPLPGQPEPAPAAETRYVLLGRPEDTARWCRERGISPASRRVVRVWHNAVALRGHSGPFEVLTFESWAGAPPKVQEQVRESLAIIRATSRPAAGVGTDG